MRQSSALSAVSPNGSCGLALPAQACGGSARKGTGGRSSVRGGPALHWPRQVLLECPWCGSIPAGQACHPGPRSVCEAAALGLHVASPSPWLSFQSASLRSCGSEGLACRSQERPVRADFKLYEGPCTRACTLLMPLSP